ncbi:MAG: hypothetical protein R3F07_07260 [Opitutaceae bacterium]
MLDRLVVILARFLFESLRALPLRGAARLGRFFGGMAHLVDRRHRKVAVTNLTAVFGNEKTRNQIAALARENFKRIGESFVCGVCTAGISPLDLDKILEVDGGEKLLEVGEDGRSPSRILALGHFGNFEIFATAAHRLPGMQLVTTYRAVKPAALNDLLLSYRQSLNCVFLERTRDAAKLKSMLKAGGVVIGLLSDQNGGPRGIKGPFLGVECSTSAAPAVFARRFHYPFHVAVCYRTSLARWRIEISDAIPLLENGGIRTAEAITADMNRIFEEAVRRDPANWFWVHNRWRLVA